MNNLQDGILIEWLKPVSERDYNNLVEGVDFIILNYNKPCPRMDGALIDFTGVPNAENLEWLIKSMGNRAGVDFRLYMENIASRPTQTADADYQNYHQYITEYGNVRRTNDELIAAIRQMEATANLSVQSESEKNKIAMMAPAVNAALAQNLHLTDSQQVVYNRMIEIANKADQNAANAKSLIDIVNAGGIPDIDSGWEYDNVSPQGYPFNA